jgi:hypothetical protein
MAYALVPELCEIAELQTAECSKCGLLIIPASACEPCDDFIRPRGEQVPVGRCLDSTCRGLCYVRRVRYGRV